MASTRPVGPPESTRYAHPVAAAQAKPRRRNVDSGRDFKHSAFVVNMGPLPVVNLSSLGSEWHPPADPSQRPPSSSYAPQARDAATVTSEWTQHFDEEVGSHYYFNESTGALDVVRRRALSWPLAQVKQPGWFRTRSIHDNGGTSLLRDVVFAHLCS